MVLLLKRIFVNVCGCREEGVKQDNELVAHQALVAWLAGEGDLSPRLGGLIHSHAQA